MIRVHCKRHGNYSTLCACAHTKNNTKNNTTNNKQQTTNTHRLTLTQIEIKLKAIIEESSTKNKTGQDFQCVKLLLLLFVAVVWCCLVLFGGVVWCCLVLQLFGVVVWCCLLWTMIWSCGLTCEFCGFMFCIDLPLKLRASVPGRQWRFSFTKHCQPPSLSYKSGCLLLLKTCMDNRHDLHHSNCKLSTYVSIAVR